MLSPYIPRAGETISWDNSIVVVKLLLITAAAFMPLILLRRFRSAWARGICYPMGGLLAFVIILATIGGMLGTA